MGPGGTVPAEKGDVVSEKKEAATEQIIEVNMQDLALEVFQDCIVLVQTDLEDEQIEHQIFLAGPQIEMVANWLLKHDPTKVKKEGG